MTTELSRRLSHELGTWSAAQIEVIRQQVAPKATDPELALFLNVAKASGLDPFRKQIYAIHRYDRSRDRQVMAIQTGIDGYRLIAERSGVYVGNDEPEFVEGGKFPTLARVTVWKLVAGERCGFTASARWSEYYPGERGGAMWRRMPHVMLGKVAEALALRKAFPGDLSGLHTHEEMEQANEPITVESRVVERREPTELQQAEHWARGWINRLQGDARKRGEARLQEILEQPEGDRLRLLREFSEAIRQVFDAAEERAKDSGRQQKQPEPDQQTVEPAEQEQSAEEATTPPADPAPPPEPEREPDPDFVAGKEKTYRTLAGQKGLPDEDAEAELKRCAGNPDAIDRAIAALVDGQVPTGGAA